MTNAASPHANDLVAALSAPARHAPESGIVEVMNYGRRSGRDVMPLWAGEGDLPTPSFITEAAAEGLRRGETFYTWQRGIPDLRETLARYHARLYGKTFEPEQFYITGSGMQAIQIVLAMVAQHGDEVLIPTPTWPNAAAAAGVIGARAVEIPMTCGNAGWTLDFERIERAITPKTRALFLVSPSNPTGWTATLDDLRHTLAMARKHGLWIVADETYARFWYGEGARAPSYLDVMEADDRVLFVNTFSKNWAMTGWRMGWILAHPSLGQVIENLIQYSTSGVAQFMQRAGVAAIEHGEAFVAEQIARARASRDILTRTLATSPRVRFSPPDGAFYLFFSVDGVAEMRQLAFRLIDEGGVGLAPGTAFGAGGDNFLRLCFARNSEHIRTAADSVVRVLAT